MPFESCIQKQREIQNLFKDCKTNEDKYLTIMNLGKDLGVYPDEQKLEPKKVSGCQSVVFLHSTLKDGNLYFQAHSEALISAGLAKLLILAYSGESPKTILMCPPTFIDELGIAASLTPGRANGLLSMHLRMKQEALQFIKHSLQ